MEVLSKHLPQRAVEKHEKAEAGQSFHVQAKRPLGHHGRSQPHGFQNWLLGCEVEVLRRFGGTYCFDLQG
jgi:hypothetical protein